jgi:choline dehydrogenase-like flavoprotein
MGTARMGTDPARSVVNEWGRSHDVKNLFIVDGSVFVTSGGVNPTSTIQALALYIADRSSSAWPWPRSPCILPTPQRPPSRLCPMRSAARCARWSAG